MEKLYYNRPYIKSFEAEVVSCVPGKDGQFEVILDRTGFYPEGGGQPADTGVLGGVRVLDVHEKEIGIVHVTDGPLAEKSHVTGEIDWTRRLNHMQNHSGEHILSGLIHRDYGYDNVGFHMGKEEVTIDFNGLLTMEQIEAAEWEVNEIIASNVPILEYYPTREELKDIDYRSKKELTGQVRIIEIPGSDVCACCGTHVMNTGEIGLLKVTGMIHYKGGVRMTMVCGLQALTDYRKKQKTVSDLSVLLSAKPGLVTEAVEKLKEESGQKDARINRLYQELFETRTAALKEQDGPLVLFESGLGPVQLRQFATLLYERGKGGEVLVCSGEEGRYQYALGSASSDMRKRSKELNACLNGRGGGSALMAQGTFLAAKEEIRKAFCGDREGGNHGVK